MGNAQGSAISGLIFSSSGSIGPQMPGAMSESVSSDPREISPGPSGGGGFRPVDAPKSGTKWHKDDTKKWFEAKSDDGHIYFWHVETNGNRWCREHLTDPSSFLISLQLPVGTRLPRVTTRSRTKRKRTRSTRSRSRRRSTTCTSPRPSTGPTRSGRRRTRG